ncbi:hypothetical protein ASE95_13790 [Sphingomonas sp. Leaf231]|nr:hypothetical protein ASE95_13790 [Sphingomonas sp. Leaf231]
MSFTDAERQHWLTAKRAGLDPDDYSPEGLAAELADREADDGDDEGASLVSVCEHCGHSLPYASTEEFALCDACDG